MSKEQILFWFAAAGVFDEHFVFVCVSFWNKHTHTHTHIWFAWKVQAGRQAETETVDREKW